MKTILRNTFHGTEATVRVDLGKVLHDLMTAGLRSPEYRRAVRIRNRLRKQLCGVEGCTCGGEFGERA